MDFDQWIELARANPWAATIAALPVIALAIRYVRANGPTPVPGTTWAKVCAVLDLISGVISTAKVDAIAKPGDSREATAQRMTAENVEVFRAQLARDPGRGRPLIRAIVRRLAKKNGMDTADLTDDEIDGVIIEATRSAGPIKDLLSWIFAHPEAILAILKLLLLFAADEPKPNDAHEVSA